ncbi:iron complex outermembrane recepter protein [Sphingobium faniae]|nr:iron complex outermembrane recepter protein [Sphingobium faniae]
MRKNIFMIGVSFGSLLAMGTTAAYAQETQASDTAAADQIGEIVVTAQKREQRLQDVPVAVAALSGDSLARAGTDSTAGLVSLVPGLNLNSNPIGFQPFIRGVGTTSYSPGNESSVATYVDNIYMAGSSSGLLNLSNIQSISVLKGPQGTLFGRNATGGVIQITTKDPSHEFGGEATIGYGNYDTFTGSAYITGGLSDNVAMDLAAFYSNQNDGFGTNWTTGNPVGMSKTYTLRSKILITPGDNDKITLSGDYSYYRNSGFSTRNFPGFSSQWGGPGLAADPLLGNPFVPTTSRPWDIDHSFDPSNSGHSYGGSLVWEHEFPFATLTSYSAARHADNDQAWNYGAAPLPVEISGWHRSERQFTEELQLASPKGSPVQWILGAFYIDSHTSYNQNVSGTAFLFGPGVQGQFRSKLVTKSPSFYGQFTVPVPSLGETNITGGLRYTIDTRKIDGGIDIFPQPDPAHPVLNTNPADLIVSIAPAVGSITYRNFSWRLGIDHHFTRDNMIYLTYNRGFKSGGYNAVPPSPVPYAPETLDAYELGLKNKFFDGRAIFNVAAFYYQYNNLQVTQFDGTSATTINAAKARIWGIEYDLTLNVIDNLQITVGGQHLNHKYVSYPDGPVITPVPVALGGGITITPGDLSGHPLNYTSDDVVNIGFDYTLPTSFGKFQLSSTVSYNSGYAFEPSTAAKQPSFYDVTASLGVTFNNDRTKLLVWGKNLANEAIAVAALSGGNPGGYFATTYRPPRTYGVSISQTF